MRFVLSSVLAIHWMAIFAMLAIVSTAEPARGGLAAFELLGIAVTHPGVSEHGELAAILTLGFALVTVLFLWTLLTSFFGRDAEAEEVSRFAFAGAVIALTALSVVGVVHGATGLFVTVGTLLVALVASYLAIFAERWLAMPDEHAAESVNDAKAMAAGAAHNAVLARLSGRTPGSPEQRR
jgi:hypothetical protein